MVRMTQAQLDAILKKRSPVQEKKAVGSSHLELNLDAHIVYLKEKMNQEAPAAAPQAKQLRTYIFKRVKNSTCGWEVDEAATQKNKEAE